MWQNYDHIGSLSLQKEQKRILTEMILWTPKPIVCHDSGATISVMASQINGISTVVQSFVHENIKAPRYWQLWGDPPATGGFPSQKDSNAENVPIWWHHHATAEMKCRSSVMWCIASLYFETRAKWFVFRIRTIWMMCKDCISDIISRWSPFHSVIHFLND